MKESANHSTMQPLRVLLLCRPGEKSATLSGVHRYFHELVRAMDGSVEYVYLDESAQRSEVRDQRSEVRSQESEVGGQIKGKTAPGRRIGLPADLALVVGYIRETLALARRLRPFRTGTDILHVVAGGCEISPIAGRLAGFGRILDTVQVMHGDVARAQHWFRRLVERLCFRSADCHIAVSNATFDDWKARVGLQRDKCVTIFNGMRPPDLSGFDRRAYRAQFCDNPDRMILIGICARLHPMKGHAVLLEGFAETLRSQRSEVRCQSSGNTLHVPRSTSHAPQLILLIAGEGPERGNIERKIRELGIERQVKLLGHRTDAVQFIASLDVHVLPSVAMETIGYANIEAMFAGVPCIVSDTGGMKEIVGPSGGGRIVPARDVRALREAMRYYVENPEARRQDGQKGREFAHRHLTAKAMAEATKRVYEKMAEEEG